MGAQKIICFTKLKSPKNIVATIVIEQVITLIIFMDFINFNWNNISCCTSGIYENTIVAY